VSTLTSPVVSPSGEPVNFNDQDRLLEEAAAVVREQAYYMRQAVDNDSLRDMLKHGSNMICELRTSLLSPKTYYELYMMVFNELQLLAAYFQDRQRHGQKMKHLYESVQHAGNILPRLYLLVTVGVGYIKSKEDRACEILRDLTELSKGVQHPMRGLFLRFFSVFSFR
jgi:vacuolar protein sorting-associated protein 35